MKRAYRITVEIGHEVMTDDDITRTDRLVRRIYGLTNQNIRRWADDNWINFTEVDVEVLNAGDARRVCNPNDCCGQVDKIYFRLTHGDYCRQQNYEWYRYGPSIPSMPDFRDSGSHDASDEERGRDSEGVDPGALPSEPSA